jgi:hypothetical protein
MSGSVYFEGNAFIDGGRSQNITITGSSVANCAITTSSIDMNLANITSVRDPINNQDAATKKYVDDLGIVLSTITLSGVSTSQISSQQKGSFVITVSNIVLNGPSATFHVTKNEASKEAHVVRITACPGTNTNTFLKISWPPSSGIYLNKTGTSFDGSYKIKVM